LTGEVDFEDGLAQSRFQDERWRRGGQDDSVAELVRRLKVTTPHSAVHQLEDGVGAGELGARKRLGAQLDRCVVAYLAQPSQFGSQRTGHWLSLRGKSHER